MTQLFLDTRFSLVEPAWYHKYYDQNNVLHDLVSGAHSGVDISTQPDHNECRASSPVYAAAPGIVIWAGWADLFGWSVVIKHGYGLMGNRHYTYSLYGHMGTVGADAMISRSCLRVAVGWPVYTTTLLGYQGSSGDATGAHVHFMVLAGDQDVRKLVSPYDFINKSTYLPAMTSICVCN